MLAKDAITLTPANWLKARSGKHHQRAQGDPFREILF